MSHRSSLLVTCMLVVLLGAACDLFGESETKKTIAGSWRGTVTSGGSNYILTLNLEQPSNANLRRSSVSGDGRLAKGDSSWVFTISGTLTRPNLSLSLRFQSARPAQLDGEVDEELETIEAEIVGGPVSFDAASVTLERQ